MVKLKYNLLFMLIALVCMSSTIQQVDINVLVFSKTAAFRHKSIPAGKQFLREMGLQNKWHIDFSEDASLFAQADINKYNTIVLLNTTGDILDSLQQIGMKKYMAQGGGIVGIHAASDTEKKWPWYNEMIGATFKNHPKVQTASLNINKNSKHFAIDHLNTTEQFKDEWYNFLKPVAKHVNVLASLDETSYTGKQMNTKHPIVWYHYYDGGKVFYAGLGHTNEVYADERFYELIKKGILWTSDQKELHSRSEKWTSLLTENIHDNWDIFMGAPHATVKDLENIDPKSNGKNSEALGLNNDPKKVFTLIQDGNDPVMHISGEIYGAMTTKAQYQNYHLKMKFKWGTTKWEPRLKRKKDSGILYHCTGPFRKFWNVWMQSQEFQVQERDMGDYYGLKNVEIDIPSIKKNGEKEFDYMTSGTKHPFSGVTKKHPSHCNKGFDNEKPHGEWNTLELICFEDTSLHIVNGKVVMSLYNSRVLNSENEIIPLTRGQIQIQSEGAEAFYKNIQIKSISSIPRKYKKQL